MLASTLIDAPNMALNVTGLRFAPPSTLALRWATAQGG